MIQKLLIPWFSTSTLEEKQCDQKCDQTFIYKESFPVFTLSEGDGSHSEKMHL